MRINEVLMGLFVRRPQTYTLVCGQKLYITRIKTLSLIVLLHSNIMDSVKLLTDHNILN